MVTQDMDRSRLCSNESSSKRILDTGYCTDDAIDRMNRIVGLRDMTNLLQPKHEYFKDKIACIIELMAYRAEGDDKFLLYPIVGGPGGERLSRDNPYRRHQLSKSNTARRIKLLLRIIDTFKLDDFKMAFLTLTMPEQISAWLSKEKNGKDMAWRLFKKFWVWYDGRFGPGMAASVNLHTWKTEMPVMPHYHFHCLMPNYLKTEIDILDENDEKCYMLKRQEWSKQRGGMEVPMSGDEMYENKVVWFMILDKFAKKHRIEWSRPCGADRGAKKINLHFAFDDVRTEYGLAHLMHWFNYQGRYPLGDYAKYSNDNLACVNPPEWLVKYDNRARSFGWWREMSKFLPIKRNDSDKVNPVTGRIMEYCGKYTVYQVLNSGPLGFLNMVKGKPVYHRLSGAEIAWLVKVQRKRPGVDIAWYTYSGGLPGTENNIEVYM